LGAVAPKASKQKMDENNYIGQGIVRTRVKERRMAWNLQY
jgi:hypothetical protein